MVIAGDFWALLNFPYLFIAVGFWQWLLPLGLGVLGFMGQQKAAETQTEATKVGKEQVELQRELQKYMLGKRKEVYDPIETKTLLPGLVRRATTPAPWTGQAGSWAKKLGAEMTFPTTDRPR